MVPRAVRSTSLEQIRACAIPVKQAGIADPFDARISALKSELLSFTGDIWLISIVEIPSVTKNLLEKSGARIHTLIHAPPKLNDGNDTTYQINIYPDEQKENSRSTSAKLRIAEKI